MLNHALLTGVTVPVKVVTRIAAALALLSQFLGIRAMRERNVPVTDIIEEVDLFFWKQDTSGNGMHRSIAPSLVEETAVLVQRCEEVDVFLRSKPVQITNFEVGPLIHVSSLDASRILRKSYEMTVVVRITAVIAQEAHGVALGNVFRMFFHEFLDTIP